MSENNFSRDEDVEFSGKPSSFKEIVMLQLKRIAELASNEMRGGYYSISTTKNGEEREVYVTDARENYGQAVLCLAHLLYKKFDTKMQEGYDTFISEVEKIEEGNGCSQNDHRDENLVFLFEWYISLVEKF